MEDDKFMFCGQHMTISPALRHENSTVAKQEERVLAKRRCEPCKNGSGKIIAGFRQPLIYDIRHIICRSKLN